MYYTEYDLSKTEFKVNYLMIKCIIYLSHGWPPKMHSICKAYLCTSACNNVYTVLYTWSVALSVLYTSVALSKTFFIVLLSINYWTISYLLEAYIGYVLTFRPLLSLFLNFSIIRRWLIIIKSLLFWFRSYYAHDIV